MEMLRKVCVGLEQPRCICAPIIYSYTTSKLRLRITCAFDQLCDGRLVLMHLQPHAQFLGMQLHSHSSCISIAQRQRCDWFPGALSDQRAKTAQPTCCVTVMMAKWRGKTANGVKQGGCQGRAVAGGPRAAAGVAEAGVHADVPVWRVVWRGGRWGRVAGHPFRVPQLTGAATPLPSILPLSLLVLAPLSGALSRLPHASACTSPGPPQVGPLQGCLMPCAHQQHQHCDVSTCTACFAAGRC